MTDGPHSALYLTDARDLWWNADFLELLGRRAGLSSVGRALDVGAGHGHWTRTVARLLPPGASVVGLEREPLWVERARSGPAVPGIHMAFEQGQAQALPFPEASFDLVTCQTLLIHVPDPRAVVAEMTRVLRPGGRLLLCEPNNVASAASRLMTGPDFDVEEVVATLELQALGERGKAALGQGFDSQGESLVSLLNAEQHTDVQVWLNDRCVVYAPGIPRHQRVELRDERRYLDGGALTWSREDTRTYYLAGGGDGARFDHLWQLAWRATERRLAAVEEGRLSTNEGGLFYVLCARKRP